MPLIHWGLQNSCPILCASINAECSVCWRIYRTILEILPVTASHRTVLSSVLVTVDGWWEHVSKQTWNRAHGKPQISSLQVMAEQEQWSDIVVDRDNLSVSSWEATGSDTITIAKQGKHYTMFTKLAIQYSTVYFMSVRIAQHSNGLWAGQLVFDSLQRQNIFLGPIQSSFQLTQRVLSPRVKWLRPEADHWPPSSPEVKNGGDIIPLPHTSSWHDA
jgi:hypothetical protein